MNKFRYIITLLLPLLLAASSYAGERNNSKDYPRFTFGAEGYAVQTFADYSHFNFISREGERVDIKGMALKYFINGQFLLNAGINVSRNVNISLNIGYAGVDKGERICPLTMRATWFIGNNPLASRWFTLLDTGTAIGSSTEKPALLGKIGGGYRISLNRICKLDFLINFQCAFIHPPTYEMIEGNPIDSENLRRNNSIVSSFGVGIGLNF